MPALETTRARTISAVTPPLSATDGAPCHARFRSEYDSSGEIFTNGANRLRKIIVIIFLYRIFYNCISFYELIVNGRNYPGALLHGKPFITVNLTILKGSNIILIGRTAGLIRSVERGIYKK